ncbi:MAG: hypothetical protein Q4D13_05565 [Erysipelotrichaceae bacterium]|nr:hypothetical protein [Erysipelotrichaceae bacterium]
MKKIDEKNSNFLEDDGVSFENDGRALISVSEDLNMDLNTGLLEPKVKEENED